MSMKPYIYGLKSYRLLVLEEHSVPGLCTDLSHMRMYVHSGNMAMVSGEDLAQNLTGFYQSLKKFDRLKAARKVFSAS